MFEKRIKRFQQNHFAANLSKYQQLRHGQNPKILFITCSDSRVLPEKLLQAGPGDVFTIEIAGNIISSGAVKATIQYALKALDIDNIIVCGHTHCGAMSAIINPSAVEEMQDVKNLIKNGPKLDDLDDGNSTDNKEVLLQKAVEANVLMQITKIKKDNDYIECCKRKSIQVLGWVYHFENGSVSQYNETTGEFEYLVKPYRNHIDIRFLLSVMGVISNVSGLILVLTATTLSINPLFILSSVLLVAGSAFFMINQDLHDDYSGASHSSGMTPCCS